MTSITHFRSIATALLAATVLVAPQAAIARDGRRIPLDLPAQPLADALRSLALASGQTVLADTQVVGSRLAPSVRGTFTVGEALTLLLAGSDLQSVEVGDAYAVRPVSARLPGEGSGANTPEILVTGARTEPMIENKRAQGVVHPAGSWPGIHAASRPPAVKASAAAIWSGRSASIAPSGLPS